jgi:hypothetical protein
MMAARPILQNSVKFDAKINKTIGQSNWKKVSFSVMTSLPLLTSFSIVTSLVSNEKGEYYKQSFDTQKGTIIYYKL